jgi:hypothetical protein
MTYARADLSVTELEAQAIIELPTRELLHVVINIALFTASAGGGGSSGAIRIAAADGSASATSVGGSGGDASILTVVLPGCWARTQ